MNKILIILILLTLLISCNKKQESDLSGWQLVYVNNGQGDKVIGDKEKLKKAIEQGCQVRVAWAINLSDSTKIKHLTDAAFLSIHRNEVFAQTESIVRQIPQRNKPIIDLDTLNNKKWYSIVGTTGEMRSTFSGTQSNRVRTVNVSWYINGNNCLTKSN